jgi:tryptophan halogenase
MPDGSGGFRFNTAPATATSTAAGSSATTKQRLRYSAIWTAARSPLFPNRDCDPYLADQYNRVVFEEMQGIRDFLALHYHSTKDRPQPLWEYCRAMRLPDSLLYKEEHFSRSGRIVLSSDELFKDASWFAVLTGQGHEPRDYNPLIDSMTSEENAAYLQRIKSTIQAAVAKMADHSSFLSAG